jgi:hypothetical protein
MIDPNYNEMNPLFTENIELLEGQFLVVEVFNCTFNQVIEGYAIKVYKEESKGDYFICHLLDNNIGLLSCLMTYSIEGSILGKQGLPGEVIIWACKYFKLNIYSSSLNESNYRFYNSEGRVPKATKLWRKMMIDSMSRFDFKVKGISDYYVIIYDPTSFIKKTETTIHSF